MKKKKNKITYAVANQFIGALMYDIMREIPEFKEITDQLKEQVRKVCLENLKPAIAKTKTVTSPSNKNTCKNASTVAIRKNNLDRR